MTPSAYARYASHVSGEKNEQTLGCRPCTVNAFFDVRLWSPIRRSTEHRLAVRHMGKDVGKDVRRRWTAFRQDYVQEQWRLDIVWPQRPRNDTSVSSRKRQYLPHYLAQNPRERTCCDGAKARSGRRYAHAHVAQNRQQRDL